MVMKAKVSRFLLYLTVIIINLVLEGDCDVSELKFVHGINYHGFKSRFQRQNENSNGYPEMNGYAYAVNGDISSGSGNDETLNDGASRSSLVSGYIDKLPEQPLDNVQANEINAAFNEISSNSNGYNYEKPSIPFEPVAPGYESRTGNGNEPTYPSSPSVPSVPSAPQYPSSPSDSEYPSPPTAPSAPQYPSSPSDSEYPSSPTAPSAPEYPGPPSVPSAPEYPSSPSDSEYPSSPTAPGAPSSPQYPGTSVSNLPSLSNYPTSPSHPHAPEYLASPPIAVDHEYSTTPGISNYPESPSTPNVPSAPGSPQYPESPAAPSGPTAPQAPGHEEGPDGIFLSSPSPFAPPKSKDSSEGYDYPKPSSGFPFESQPSTSFPDLPSSYPPSSIASETPEILPTFTPSSTNVPEYSVQTSPTEKPSGPSIAPEETPTGPYFSSSPSPFSVPTTQKELQETTEAQSPSTPSITSEETPSVLSQSPSAEESSSAAPTTTTKSTQPPLIRTTPAQDLSDINGTPGSRVGIEEDGANIPQPDQEKTEQKFDGYDYPRPLNPMTYPPPLFTLEEMEETYPKSLLSEIDLRFGS